MPFFKFSYSYFWVICFKHDKTGGSYQTSNMDVFFLKISAPLIFYIGIHNDDDDDELFLWCG